MSALKIIERPREDGRGTTEWLYVIVVDTQREFESSKDTRLLAGILHARFVKVP